MPEDVAYLCCVDGARGPVGNPGDGYRELEKEARRFSEPHLPSFRERKRKHSFLLSGTSQGQKLWVRRHHLLSTAFDGAVVGTLWPWQGSQAGWVAAPACGFMT